MLAAVLLAFREGLEVALILGIVLSVLRRFGPRAAGQARVVWLGAGLAGLLSLGIGLGLQVLGVAFEGKFEQLFEGSAMLLAAAVLTWMIFWMARQGRTLQADLERDTRRAAIAVQGWPLFTLAFLAVLREGVELALFLTAAAFTGSARETWLGGLIGLLASVVTGWVVFASALRLHLKTLFRATGTLLVFFAAGLVAHSVHEFNEAGWIPALIEPVWNLNPVLDEDAGLGMFLKALIGYNGNPSLTEVMAYGAYWAIVLGSLWYGRRQAIQPLVEPAASTAVGD